MMRDIDAMIDEALGEEESELLRRIGGNPGFIENALGMFGDRVLWVVAVMMVVQAVAFIAGVWAAWMFFEAVEPVAQLRWGLPAAVLLLMALIIKVSVAPAMHAKRLMRELKRIELQLARSRQGGSG
jgi:hypothetical protein